jgi:hypothetical protein
MRSLLNVAAMLARGGTPAEGARTRLMATGTALATWFLFGAANVLALRGHLDERLGPASQPGTRGGTAFALVLLVLPVAAFLYQSSRLASADRERRLSALRLAGATPSQVRLLGMAETTRAALIGTVTGAATYLLLQWAARRLLLDPRSPADVGVPPLLCAAAMVIVLAAAAVSGLLAGRHVVATPLSVTVRANHRPPRRYPIALLVAGLLLIVSWPVLPFPLRYFAPLAGAVILVAGLLLSPSSVVWLSARATGRRARSAETLLAARALEADARPWGRALSVVGLTVAVGSVVGWFEADTLEARRATETFFLSSFILIDLALLVAMAVAASALFVHHAEYFLERGPVLATLRATGTPETALRRVLVRQALIAAIPVCVIAALPGLLVPGIRLRLDLWSLWPLARALLMAALGVLAAVLSAALSRRRLRRTISPVLLRTE